jgi:hypothetical protein
VGADAGAGAEGTATGTAAFAIAGGTESRIVSRAKSGCVVA